MIFNRYLNANEYERAVWSISPLRYFAASVSAHRQGLEQNAHRVRSTQRFLSPAR